MIRVLEKLKGLINKLSPTASQVHVPVPISRDDKIKKVIADYNLISSKMKELKKEITLDNQVESVDTNQEDIDVYRGKSF